MDERGLGLWLLAIGLILVVLGGLVWLGAFSWFGRLPGDLRFGNENFRVYIPLTTMILLSVVLTLLLSIINRLR